MSDGVVNPYFDEVAGGVTVGGNRSGYADRHLETLRRRDDLVKEYAWAIPNHEAVATIAMYTPILEVGAGGGYWAALVSDAGADVIATDIDPSVPCYHPVWEADARTIVTDYPDRTLLLVWPTYGESWATAALGAYASAGGETCIYVGEGRGGCTADDRFHQMLHEEWTCEETVAIPSYLGIHDRLEVWAR